METDNHDERVEQYVLGRLAGDSLQSFEQQLRDDETLRKQVDAEAILVKHLKREGRQQYRLKLKDLHQRMEQAARVPGREVPLLPLPVKESVALHRFRWVAAAGIALLLVGSLAVGGYHFTRPTAPAALFTAYFQPYPATQIVRGGPGGAAPETAGLVAYSQGKYPESIVLFRQALARENQEVALFYLGNACLAAGQPTEAIDAYSKYLQIYGEYEVEARWYLGLSYLKAGNTPGAQKALEALAGRPNRYRNDAARLLDALE